MQDIRKNNYVLTPGRYIDFAAEVEDDKVFDEKMKRLSAILQEQIKQAQALDEKVKENLTSIGYGW